MFHFRRLSTASGVQHCPVAKLRVRWREMSSLALGCITQRALDSMNTSNYKLLRLICETLQQRQSKLPRPIEIGKSVSTKQGVEKMARASGKPNATRLCASHVCRLDVPEPRQVTQTRVQDWRKHVIINHN